MGSFALVLCCLLLLWFGLFGFFVGVLLFVCLGALCVVGWLLKDSSCGKLYFIQVQIFYSTPDKYPHSE